MEPLEPTLAAKILWIVKQQPDLTNFETDILNDRLEAIQTYGASAVITEKQKVKILEIYDKVYLKSLKPLKRTKCVHCKKDAGNHNAKTKACPIGKKHRTMGYTSYHRENVFSLEKKTEK